MEALATQWEIPTTKVSHYDYYSGYVTADEKRLVVDAFGFDSIINSTDYFFGDLPTSAFKALPMPKRLEDRMPLLGETVCELTKVCVYKCAAAMIRRQYAKEDDWYVTVELKSDRDETVFTKAYGTVDTIYDYYLADGGTIAVEDGHRTIESLRFRRVWHADHDMM